MAARQSIYREFLPSTMKSENFRSLRLKTGGMMQSHLINPLAFITIKCVLSPIDANFFFGGLNANWPIVKTLQRKTREIDNVVSISDESRIVVCHR